MLIFYDFFLESLENYFATGGRCSFPDEWKGQYFQSGLGNVIIRRSLVTTKGTCVDQHRDYFLFANRFVSAIDPP
jgi:hypothetical protein